MKRVESWDAQLASLGVSSDAAEAAKRSVESLKSTSGPEALRSLLLPRGSKPSEIAKLDAPSESSVDAELGEATESSELEAEESAEAAPAIPAETQNDASESRALYTEGSPEPDALERSDSGPEGAEAAPENRLVVEEDSAAMSLSQDPLSVEARVEPSPQALESEIPSAEVPTPALNQSELGWGDDGAQDSGVQIRVPAAQADFEASVSASSHQDDDEPAAGLDLEDEFEELQMDSDWDEDTSLQPREIAPPPPPPVNGAGPVAPQADDDEFSGLMALDVRRNLGFGDLTPHMFTPCPDRDESQQQ